MENTTPISTGPTHPIRCRNSKIESPVDISTSIGVDKVCITLHFDFPRYVGPNITGGITLSHLDASNASGSITLAKGGAANYGTSASSRAAKIELEASLSSFVYGLSTTVQPASVQFLACIKI